MQVYASVVLLSSASRTLDMERERERHHSILAKHVDALGAQAMGKVKHINIYMKKESVASRAKEGMLKGLGASQPGFLISAPQPYDGAHTVTITESTRSGGTGAVRPGFTFLDPTGWAVSVSNTSPDLTYDWMPRGRYDWTWRFGTHPSPTETKRRYNWRPGGFSKGAPSWAALSLTGNWYI